MNKKTPLAPLQKTLVGELVFGKQQTEIINFSGEHLLVLAGAGTGKTTTLVQFALANPRVRMLYIAFNKAIQLEAERKFPPNVICRTIHSIAYQRVGKFLAHKLTGNLRVSDVRVFLGNPSWKIVNDTITAFNNFLVSSDKRIGNQHAEHLAGKTSKHDAEVAIAVAGAVKMWQAASDKDDPFPATHDVYLKLYCLTEPEMHKWFKYILLDEAQDTNPVTGEFVMSQKCHQILVGDDHQQIYRWRGANNSMADFKKKFNAKTLFLTQSFRFGKSTANMANAILAYKRKISGCDKFEVQGLPSIDDKWVKAEDMVRTKHAALHRTVMGAIETALKHPNKKIWWIGGLENYNIQELIDVYHLSTGESSKIKRKKLLVEFKSFDSYKLASENSGDPEMVRATKMIESFKHNFNANIELLRKMEVKTESEADMVIGTIHRAKGLEFDRVLVADDFKDFTDPGKSYSQEMMVDELNLLYVGCTRAVYELASNPVMYKIFSEMSKGNKATPLPAKNTIKKSTTRKAVPVIND